VIGMIMTMHIPMKIRRIQKSSFCIAPLTHRPLCVQGIIMVPESTGVCCKIRALEMKEVLIRERRTSFKREV